MGMQVQIILHSWISLLEILELDAEIWRLVYAYYYAEIKADTLVREGKSCVKISRTTELKSKMCNILPDRGRVPWKRVDGRQDTFMWNL
ncbi:hypothetical protein T01_7105 [Trichinella spiralis]|uniref:Uncharacterized protein n=1 Tax=Trichinella spiralis TaxID=6334 RepID=A0A0V1BU06_TRISP|nr:hypothetical protein T01_7105 [Trichinella spiralis]